MKIWIDGDAAPKLMKDVVYRCSDRLGLPVTVVANSWQQTPRSDLIKMVVVGDAFDAADDYIAEQCAPKEVVITADIPLAARIVAAGAAVITPRGEELDTESIDERLAVRNFMEEMRSADLVGGGPPPYGDRDRQQFANTLDRVVTRLRR